MLDEKHKQPKCQSRREKHSFSQIRKHQNKVNTNHITQPREEEAPPVSLLRIRRRPGSSR